MNLQLVCSHCNTPLEAMIFNGVVQVCECTTCADRKAARIVATENRNAALAKELQAAHELLKRSTEPAIRSEAEKLIERIIVCGHTFNRSEYDYLLALAKTEPAIPFIKYLRTMRPMSLKEGKDIYEELRHA